MPGRVLRTFWNLSAYNFNTLGSPWGAPLFPLLRRNLVPNSEVPQVESEAGPHTQKARTNQRKRQTSPDWWWLFLGSTGGSSYIILNWPIVVAWQTRDEVTVATLPWWHPVFFLTVISCFSQPVPVSQGYVTTQVWDTSSSMITRPQLQAKDKLRPPPFGSQFPIYKL